MSTIRVRRSGLVAFAVRLASVITGLVFVVLTTNNISVSDFGLWQLIGRTIGYIGFGGLILTFWTVRYRARSIKLGTTVTLGSVIFSAVLSAIYIPVAIVSARALNGNHELYLFYFLLSLPQIGLYTVTGTLEAILMGYFPERASLGFIIFELSKVAVGVITIVLLHLSLEGAILSLIGASTVQIVALLFFTRGEYSDKFTPSLLNKMIRTGWLALLSNLHPILISLDYVVVAYVTGSQIPLAYYGAALTVSYIVAYSGWLTSGLYINILAGKDSKSSTSQIFELQLLFIMPMALGGIILSTDILKVFHHNYALAWPILVVLAVGAAFSAVATTPETVIMGTDMSDLSERTDFSLYLKSKLFFLSKLNIGLALGYVLGVGILSALTGPGYLNANVNLAGYTMPGYIALGTMWSMIALAMYAIGFAVKIRKSWGIYPIQVDRGTIFALVVASLLYSVVLRLLSINIQTKGGTIEETAYVVAFLIVGVAVYASTTLILSKSVRQTARGIIGYFLK
jgi:O-antigen/teichoic acid export membrane protein